MRIRKIQIANFGKWRQKEWQLDSSLVFFYGGNEAGKSTIFQFIVAMLFGLPTKKRGRIPYYDEEQQSFGGKLILEQPHFGEVAIQRMRVGNQNQNVLYWPDGELAESDTIEKLLAPLTRESYLSIFALDAFEMSQQTMPSAESLQQLLLSIAVSGSDELVKQQQIFTQASNHIFKPTGTNPPLNQKLVTYQQLLQKIHAKEQSETTYQQLTASAKELAITENLLTEQHAKIVKELNLVTAQVEKWELYQDWQQTQSLLVGVSGEELSHHEFKLLTELKDQLLFLQNQETSLLNRQRHDLSVVGASPSLAFYLEHQHEVINLLNRRLRDSKAMLEKEHLQVVLDEELLELEATCEMLGWQLTALPKVADTEKIAIYQDLVAEKKQLDDKAMMLQKDLEIVDIQQNKFEKQLNGLEKGAKGLVPAILASICVIAVGFGIGYFVSAIAGTLLGILGVLGISFYFRNHQSGNKKASQNTYAQLDEVLAEREKITSALSAVHQNLENWLARKNSLAQEQGYDLASLPEDWLQHQGTLNRVSRLNQQVLEQQKTYQELETRLNESYQGFDFLKEWLPIGNQDLTACYDLLVEFQQKMQQEKKLLQNQEANVDIHEIAIIDAQRQQQELWQKNHELLAQHHVHSLAELQHLLQESQHWQTINEKDTALAQELATLFPANQNYQILALEEKLANLQREREKLAENLAASQRQQREYQFQLEKLTQDGELTDLYQQQTNSEAEIQTLVDEWLQKRLAAAILEDSLIVLSENQLPQLLQTASEYLAILTENHFVEIVYQAEQMLLRTNRQENFYPQDLSTGTYHQLILALRLAFIVLNRKSCEAPVIIDDSWLHFDHQRKQAFFQLIDRVSQMTQIICFSSDQAFLDYCNQHQKQVILLEKEV